MWSICSLFVFLAFISMHSIHAQSTGDSCQTPSGGAGSCINIKQCEPLLQILMKPKPLATEDLRLVQQSQCGFEGRTPKVCCPADAIVENQDPPNVDNHRNVGMINPDKCGSVTRVKIIGGNRTGIYEFPWMALIAYRQNNQLKFGCGGTLINERYVLTAAHCITNLGQRTLAGVRLGEHNIDTDKDCETVGKNKVICSPGVQDFIVQEAIPHAQYSPTTLINDIGLIRLNKKPNFVANVQAICLPLGNLRDFKDKIGIVAGWGATESGESSSELLKVQLPVVPNDDCGKIYNRTAPITYKHLCAGGGVRKDSCGGDSGGPLMYPNVVHEDSRFVQNAIVSFGPYFCGTEGRPGVYSRVAFYMDWILDNLKPF